MRNLDSIGSRADHNIHSRIFEVSTVSRTGLFLSSFLESARLLRPQKILAAGEHVGLLQCREEGRLGFYWDLEFGIWDLPLGPFAVSRFNPFNLFNRFNPSGCGFAALSSSRLCGLLGLSVWGLMG